ncbi:hypothetical protein BZL29_3460 [Mycobacterium kansasii]|uniref:Uncharacterized protein n=1 Tax=Mycobacterium kansasii TaxID=1768 RepID=A0A1V3XD94_MYCKA|nr:hypothetical protein BZL29_3460 [Mycobacterium kansasii]
MSLTQEFVEANSAEKLRSVVNSSILPAGTQLSTKLVDQGSQAGDLLGIALLSPVNPANPPAPPVDDAQRDTVLAALRETGFITYPPADHFGVANAAIVITGGACPQMPATRGPAWRGSPLRWRRTVPAPCSPAGMARRRQRGRRSHPRRCRHGRHRQHRRRRRRRARPHHGDPGPARPHQRRATGPLWHRSRGHVGDCSPIVPR